MNPVELVVVYHPNCRASTDFLIKASKLQNCEIKYINVKEDNIETNKDNIPECEPLYISTKTKVLFLNQTIDLNDIFWKIPILEYSKQETINFIVPPSLTKRTWENPYGSLCIGIKPKSFKEKGI